MFATNEERFALKNANDFGLDFVVRIRVGERESEIACDDLEHALDTNGAWVNQLGADYVEIFRVLDDGSLKPTLGGFYRNEN